jgi:type II secretory pathway component PulM
MNEYLARARAFWGARTHRERISLMAAAGTLLLALGYALIFDPLLKANAKLAASLPRQRAELQLMRAQVGEIERLRSKARTASPSGGSLVHTIETAAAAHGAREVIASLVPLAKDRVQVTTRAMPVRAWLAWFADLQRQGVSVVSCRVTADEKPGQVSVEAMLMGGASG